MTVERITSGYAALKTDSSDVPIQVSGVAIGDGDITTGGSGKKTLWPGETLKDAPLRNSRAALEGQPIATDLDHTANNPQAQTPSEAVTGGIEWAGFKDGVGVLYEGEIDDPNIARSVENNRLEVSPLVSREVEPLEGEVAEKYEELGYNVDEADYVATEIKKWRDIATVVNGAAPSNKITVGSNPMKAEALHEAIESLQSLTPPEQAQENAQQVLEWREEHGDEVDAMTETGWNRAEQLASGEELSPEVIKKMAQFNRHRSNSGVADEYEGEPWKDNGHVAWLGWGGDAGIDWAIEHSDEMDESMAEGHEAQPTEALKEVAGVEFDGTADGELDESELPSEGYESHYLYPGDTKTESSYPVVDVDGNLRRGNVDAAWSLGARGDANDETHDERLLELAQEFDNPPEWAEKEAMAEDIDEPAESGTDTQSDEGTNGSRSPSSVAANSEETMTEDLTDTEKAILEAAEGVDEPTEALNEYAATEGPTIVAQSEYESLQENVEEVRNVLSEALAEKTELKESTIDALGFEALCDEFRNDEGDLQVEALRQVPESGEPETEDDAEALSEDADVDKAEALYADYQSMAHPPKSLETDITEALGVSEFEEATEVLN